MLRCLEKDPEDRYPSALAFLSGLEEAFRKPAEPGLIETEIPDTLMEQTLPADPDPGSSPDDVPEIGAGEAPLTPPYMDEPRPGKRLSSRHRNLVYGAIRILLIIIIGGLVRFGILPGWDPFAEQAGQWIEDTYSALIGSDRMPSIEPVVGSWAGNVYNDFLAMEISVRINDGCQIDQYCGGFDITTISWPGFLVWGGMEGDMCHFETGALTETCGEGSDYLQPRLDGTLMYISRGDYGETKGILVKQP